MSEFRSQKNGFQIALHNGYTISVKFDTHNYCSNRDDSDYDFSKHDADRASHMGLRCKNAEVAVLDRDGALVQLAEHDQVKGYQSVSEVIAIMNEFNVPLCVICEKPMRLRGDEFYGAHIECAKQAVDYEAQAMTERRDEIASAS
jgi:hypothetical protein